MKYLITLVLSTVFVIGWSVKVWPMFDAARNGEGLGLIAAWIIGLAVIVHFTRRLTRWMEKNDLDTKNYISAVHHRSRARDPFRKHDRLCRTRPCVF